MQNFLGARWVSHDISCNEVQKIFGETIDPALEEGLRPFRNLLGSKGGRGGDGPPIKNVEDSSGNRYHLQPGGIPTLAEPLIATRELDDGTHQLHAKLGDMRQLEWAVKKLQTQFPSVNWNTQELREKLFPEKAYLRERLHLRTGIGGREYFRGLLKIAFNLLGAKSVDIALRPCFDALRIYIVDGNGDDKNHIRWLTTADKLAIENLGPFDHFVAVFSTGSTVDGIVQFFGGISHLIRLTDNYDGPAFCFGYQVNPLRDSAPAETRAPVFDTNLIPKFDEGHISPGPDVWPVYHALFSQFLEDHTDRACKAEIARIVDEVLLPHDGEIQSQEIIGELAHKVANFISSRMTSHRTEQAEDKESP